MTPADESLVADARLRPLLAVLHLASPALPVGGFAYSQGLEKAIEDGLVRDATTAQRWIEDLLLLALARYEAPMWLRVFDAATALDVEMVRNLNEDLLASRETAELRAESLQMGTSLLRIFPVLRLTPPEFERVTYPCAFALACAQLGVDRRAGLAAYLWSWLENQALVAVKSVPLGQQAGQGLLFALHDTVLNAVSTAEKLGDDELGGASIQFAMTAARHELQYSRLYRT